MAKARNGEGSIFPVRDKVTGNVVGYDVEISLGKKANGKRARTRRRVKTMKEAVELRTRLNHEKLQGRLSVITADTVGTYGIRWVREVKALQVRPSTAADYVGRLRREVIPMLGTTRMVDLKPAHVDAWMASLRAQGRSAPTVNGARQVLRAMCKHAFRAGILASNPVDATDPVKRQKHDPTQVLEPWSLDDVHRVLEAARDDDLDGFLHLMLHTGLRPGEAMGMRWEDIDIDSGALIVSGTLKDARALMPNGEGVVRQVRNEPKNASSKRTIPISDALLASLDRQHMRQAVQRMAATDWTDTGYVFTTSVGTPHWSSNLRRKYKRFLASIGIRYIRLHDLRHTVARIALDTGNVPIEHASQALGHTRIDTTKQIYAGYVPRYTDEFIDGISGVLPAAPRPNPPEFGDAQARPIGD